MRTLIFYSTILILAVSCVPSRQYLELQTKNQTCEEEKELLKSENEEFSVENREMKAKIEQLEKGLSSLSGDTVNKNEAIVRMQIEYKNLLDRYNKLKESQDALLKGSERETKLLLQELQSKQEEIQTREDKLKEMEVSLENKKKNIDLLQKEMEQQKARLIELEEMVAKKSDAVRDLKNKVSKALTGFEGQGLTVTKKNGKVYVSMDDKLLFASGSTEVEPNGIEALKKLAKVLEQNTDIQISIEGHTDDVPYIASEAIKDNWDLSVKRATSVIRILLSNSTLDVKRLTASGRGEFHPIDAAKTPEARAKNRRTEIILSPNLDELYKILNE